MSTIILTGGGTAGHVTPHLAILPYLKNDFEKIYYIGSKFGIEKDIITKANIPYYSVPCAKLYRKFNLQNMSIPFKLISGIKQAGKLLDELKPDIIFSKGGYVSLPTIIAAKKRKIPIISHESDFSIGLTNRITSKYCKKVLTSFPETAKEIKNGEYVGAPIRTSILTKKKGVIDSFNFTTNKPVILFTGGSQGAKAINKIVRQSLNELLPKFNIIHICGKNNLDDSIKYDGYYQIEYLDNIEDAFAVASICVSRAGSNTIFELLAIKKPTILIPLPKGTSRGDQILNAEYFQKLGIVNVLPQNVLTSKALTLAINSTYSNRHNLIRNIEGCKLIYNSSRQISRILADNTN